MSDHPDYRCPRCGSRELSFIKKFDCDSSVFANLPEAICCARVKGRECGWEGTKEQTQPKKVDA